MVTPKRKSTTAVVGDIAKQVKTENSVSISKFEKNLVQEYSKTDLDRKKEELEEFLFNAKVECEGGLNTLKYELGILEGNLRKEKSSLVAAKKAYENTRFKLASSWEGYFNTRKEALRGIEKAEFIVITTESKICETNRQLAYYQEILADLTA
jgi:hypothetical protein